MHPDLISKTIMPMLMERNCSVVLITTIGDPDNHVTKMIELVDSVTGKYLFTTIRITPVCEDCKKNGNVFKCEHIGTSATPWIGAGKQRMVLEYYKLTGQQEVAKMEVFSISADKSQKVFEEDFIKQFEKLPHFSENRKPNVLYMGIDPSGGGSSEYAIVVVWFDKGRAIIVSMDAAVINGDPTSKKSFVMGVYENLQRHPKFSGVPIIVIPEVDVGQNISFCGEFFAAPEFKDKVLVMSEARTTLNDVRHKNYGVRKTQDSTITMAGITRHALMNGCIRFHSEMTTTCRQGVDYFQKSLFKQLRAYKQVWNKTGTSATFTGKEHGLNDDQLIAFMTVLFWAKHFERTQDNPEYNRFKLLVTEFPYR